jgi:hypothetical protein
MGATLSTLRKYIRAEVNDPAPTEKMSSSTLTHDGGNGAAFFQDQSFNFVNEGILVGDVVRNITDGGSLATIRLIGNGGATNDKLTVGSIEGGTDNDYDNSDVVEIYDRHAQRGLDGTRWTDSEVEDALTQAQKIVAIRFGGVEKYSVQEDIKVMSKIDLTVQSGTFTVGETVTGGTNGHTAVVEYVGDTFLIVSTMRTKFNVTAVSGTLETGETITGGTSSETGILITDGTTYLVVEKGGTTGFTNAETLTGGTSGATVTMNDSSYSPDLFIAGETLTGGTSSATANVKATYANNNVCLGQDMPTDLKNLLVARWWDGSHWYPLVRDNIMEFTSRNTATGDPSNVAVFGVDQLTTDSAPNKKIWLWPSNATKQYNELHLFYMAWDRALSADTTTTNFDNTVERLMVLEAAKILAGQVNEEELWKRIVTDIQMLNEDITGTDTDEPDSVTETVHWNCGFSDDEGTFIP